MFVLEPMVGLMVVANGGKWALAATVEAGMSVYKGHKCGGCDQCHKKHLAFWPWKEACSIVKSSVGQARSMIEHARKARPVALPQEVASAEEAGGY